MSLPIVIDKKSPKQFGIFTKEEPMKAAMQDSSPRALTAAAVLLTAAGLLMGTSGAAGGMLEGKKPEKTAPVEETDELVIDEGKLFPGHQVGTPEFEDPFPTT